MKPIEQEFISKGILRGATLLLRPKVALDMIQRCRELGIEVIGVDGFRVTENSIQPLIEESIDISTYKYRIDRWSQAEKFIKHRINTDLFFELTLG